MFGQLVTPWYACCPVRVKLLTPIGLTDDTVDTLSVHTISNSYEDPSRRPEAFPQPLLAIAGREWWVAGRRWLCPTAGDPACRIGCATVPCSGGRQRRPWLQFRQPNSRCNADHRVRPLTSATINKWAPGLERVSHNLGLFG